MPRAVGDLADLLVQTLRDLREARYERAVYKAWFRAALDTLHEQHQEIERQRRQLAALRDENRRLAARVDSLSQAAA
jgi:chromosome segregation ATPase